MSNDIRALYLLKSRTDNHAVQNINNLKSDFTQYSVILSVPKQIFNEDYPVNPVTFGERLRTARIDVGLNIRELAILIGVTEDTVINWELRGMMPKKKSVRERLKATLGGFIDMD